MSDLVLVTGGSGYLAAWCIVTLLRRGYRVRTTVRSEAKAELVRAAVTRGGADADGLEFAVADLLADDGWAEAVEGCAGVLHVASPLTATRDAGGPMSAYVTSKALAERAAWDFMATEGGDLELSVVNPAGIFGPALSPDATSSLGLVRTLLAGTPGVPKLWMGIVDVRDVAELHVLALESQVAAGERFIAWGDGPISMPQIAALLRERLGPDAVRVSRRTLPDWLVRLAGRFHTELGDLVPLLGQRRTATSAKARNLLGWEPRPWQDTIEESARCLMSYRS